MKKIGNNYTNNIFEDIKHIDEYGNEYWFARDLQKVLEYKDWRNFLKVLDKAKEACCNSRFNVDEQLVEVNKLSKRKMNNLLRSTSCQKETIMLLLIYKIINYRDTYVI